MRATRDILYVCGQIKSGDTLHVFVVHAPSRHGGERYSRPFRQTAFMHRVVMVGKNIVVLFVRLQWIGYVLR